MSYSARVWAEVEVTEISFAKVVSDYLWLHFLFGRYSQMSDVGVISFME